MRKHTKKKILFKRFYDDIKIEKSLKLTVKKIEKLL